MTAQVLPYRWGAEGFLRAWEAGAFDDVRVEMVDGEVWPVSVGTWHGRTTARVIRALPDGGAEVTTESLVLSTSVVDPDVWVRRTAAEPVRQASARLPVWDPAEVLLVVEVGDETLQADLTVKARLYAAPGFEVYWVVSRDGVHVHTDPTGLGYRTVRQHRPGDRMPVPSGSTGATVGVSDLVGGLA